MRDYSFLTAPTWWRCATIMVYILLNSLTWVNFRVLCHLRGWHHSLVLFTIFTVSNPIVSVFFFSHVIIRVLKTGLEIILGSLSVVFEPEIRIGKNSIFFFKGWVSWCLGRPGQSGTLSLLSKIYPVLIWSPWLSFTSSTKSATPPTYPRTPPSCFYTQSGCL